MNLKLLQEVDELLETLVANCYENLENAKDSASAQEILLKSLCSIMSKTNEEAIKKKQGIGYVSRESVLFDNGDEMPLPLYPEVYDENPD